MRRLLTALAPLLFVVIVFVAIMRTGEPAPLWRTQRPTESYRADRCTWYCHNHGCRHASRLPTFLSQTLFDRAVLALHAAGNKLAPTDGFAGYRAANLIVFCAVWPAAMYALLLVALRQRRQLRALRKGAS